MNFNQRTLLIILLLGFIIIIYNSQGMISSEKAGIPEKDTAPKAPVSQEKPEKTEESQETEKVIPPKKDSDILLRKRGF